MVTIPRTDHQGDDLPDLNRDLFDRAKPNVCSTFRHARGQALRGVTATHLNRPSDSIAAVEVRIHHASGDAHRARNRTAPGDHRCPAGRRMHRHTVCGHDPGNAHRVVRGIGEDAQVLPGGPTLNKAIIGQALDSRRQQRLKLRCVEAEVITPDCQKVRIDGSRITGTPDPDYRLLRVERAPRPRRPSTAPCCR